MNWPGNPLQPLTDTAGAHPLLALLAIAAATAGARWCRGRWVRRQAEHGIGVRPLPSVLRESWRTALGDTRPALAKPAQLRELTWRRGFIALLMLTCLHLFTPSTGLFGARAWWITLAVLAAAWLTLGSHVHTIHQVRHRILLQMFEVAAGEFRYPPAAALQPWGWVQVSGWTRVYAPETTTIMFPIRYRSEDAKNRLAFETNFAGTVSDQHTWEFTWESANNRVIATPVPYIPTEAAYPFPDTGPWHVFGVGVVSGGKQVGIDVSRYPHMLVAGPTGSGKSVAQRTLLMHALSSPNWRVLLVDLKRVELSMYRTASNVLKMAVTLPEAVDVLENLHTELHERLTRMEAAQVTIVTDLDTPPPAILLMLDEVYELLAPQNIRSDEGKEIDQMHARATLLLGSLLRLGRAAGIHVIAATQRPDAKVIPGESKANMDARIAMGHMDTIPSNMVLDSDHATRIPGHIQGRGVLRTGGEFTEFQAYHLPARQLPQMLALADTLATQTPTSTRPASTRPAGAATPDTSRRRSARLVAAARHWFANRARAAAANDDYHNTPPSTRRQPNPTPTKLPPGTRTHHLGPGPATAPDPTRPDPTDSQPDLEAVSGEYGLIVADVLAAAAAAGRPVPASELVAALRHELGALTAELANLQNPTTGSWAVTAPGPRRPAAPTRPTPAAPTASQAPPEMP